MSRRRWRSWGAAALAACLILLAGTWFWARGELARSYAGWEGEAAVVTLEAGLDASSMLSRLGDAGVVRYPALLRAQLALRGGAERLQAGEYRFEEPISPLELLERLRRGEVWLHPITLPEGLTLVEVAARLDESAFGPTDEFLSAFERAELVEDFDPAAVDLEGYLFPDTYRFPLGERPERIAQAMVRQFREAVGADYGARARELGLDVRGAVILASLIERETSVAEERARISRVFHNRLQRGMRLECDPTVIYGLTRAGRTVKRLTRADLAFESPWNTYVVPGLPAGPIANPGLASLRAAVAPDEGDDLYFVAAPHGGHRFSTSLEEHLEAVREWRRYVKSSR